MSIIDIDTLKSYFNRGDKPTESQFANTIDTLRSRPINALEYGYTTDIGATVNAAFAENDTVFLPDGTYDLSTTIDIGDGQSLIGANYMNTLIDKQADVPCIEIDGSNTTLSGFRLVSSISDTTDGILGTNCPRVLIDNIYVGGFVSGTEKGMGRHGIHIVDGNLGTIKDVICLSSGQAGILFGDTAANNNAWNFVGKIDLRANQDGLVLQGGSGASDINASRSHYGGLIQAQANDRYGVHIESRSNILNIYAENNTTNNILVDYLAEGNRIYTTAGDVTDNGQGNIIMSYTDGATREATTLGLMRYGQQSGPYWNNATYVGTSKITHPRDRGYDWEFDDTGADQILNILNNSSGSVVIIELDGEYRTESGTRYKNTANSNDWLTYMDGSTNRLYFNYNGADKAYIETDGTFNTV